MIYLRRLIGRLLLLIFAIYFVVELFISIDEKETREELMAKTTVNPPPEQIVIPDRQLKLIGDFHQETLDAAAKFEEISNMDGSSPVTREARKQAKRLVYPKRKMAWNSFVTPTKFSGFVGIITGIYVSKVFDGVNAGMTRLKIEITLFGSGLQLQEVVLIDERRDQWSERGITTPWQSLVKGKSVEISGQFVKSSQSRQEAMCCVASTSYPQLSVILSDLRFL